MHAQEYQNIFQNEETHFFYRATHELVVSLVKQYTKAEDLKILDAGAGTGLLLQKLKQFGTVEGVDISQEAITLAKKRGVTLQEGSVTKLPFKNKSFDLITSIDVLYHFSIKDDQRAFEELYRCLRPGGVLILRVPAHSWLGTSHDQHVHTRHRYTLSEVYKKATKAGFQVELISYVHLFLVPFILCAKVIDGLQRKKHSKSGLSSLPPFLNTFFYVLLTWEKTVVPFFRLPAGVGVIAVLRRVKS